MDRPWGRSRGSGRRHATGAGRRPLTDFIAFLEQLPTAPLYALIALLAAVENFVPPVPADIAVSLGAFLAGRGVMNGWLIFVLTWCANVASGAAVYRLARRHSAFVSRGFLGRHIFTPNVVAQIAEQYRRHGVYGIFISRLLPIWRAVVMPFAGIAGVPASRALIPMALASAIYYGALTFLVSRLGTRLEDVLRLVGHVNSVLAIVAGGLLVIIVVWIVRRWLRRPPPPAP